MERPYLDTATAWKAGAVAQAAPGSAATVAAPRPPGGGWRSTLDTLLPLDPRRRHLLARLTRREIAARYRGSLLGAAWALLEPLLLFALYTAVFTVVFELRWGPADTSRVAFALNLFAGLVVYNVFGETLASAPRLIADHRHYVKRVVFPLEVLPAARVAGNAAHGAFGFLLLLLAVLAIEGGLPATLLLAPVVLLPLLLLCIAVAHAFSAAGVFAPDLANLARPAVMVGLFLSPIFYPFERLPSAWQPWLRLNPLAQVIGDFRRVVLEGVAPDWPGLLAVTAASAAAALLGAWAFARSRRGFADVL